MRGLARNFILVTGSRLLDGAVRFVTVPIVLGYFGRNDFGLMALAYSMHVFLTLADFSISANVIRRFSGCLVDGKLDELKRLARVATFVYACIGAVNLVAVLVIGVFADRWFGLAPREAQAFFWMMVSLGVSSLLTWLFTVYRQVLHASSQVGLDEGLNLISTFGTVLVLLAALHWQWGVQTYFAWALVPPLLPMLLRMRRAQRVVPGLGFGLSTDWPVFQPLLAGTLWLLLTTLADMAANNYRPVILTQHSGLESVADFRVIQQVAGFASLLLTGFMNVAYPAVARLDAANDDARLNLALLNGSRLLLWGHLLLLVPMAFAGALLLQLYVGASYVKLAGPLALWLVSLAAFHYTIIMSFVIARGRVRLLALASLANAALSLLAARWWVPAHGVGAMAASYSVYVLLQLGVMYFVALPSAGGGSGARLAWQVLPRPLLAAGLAAGLAMGALVLTGWPLWVGAPIFLLIFGAAAFAPGGAWADFQMLRQQRA